MWKTYLCLSIYLWCLFIFHNDGHGHKNGCYCLGWACGQKLIYLDQYLGKGVKDVFLNEWCLVGVGFCCNSRSKVSGKDVKLIGHCRITKLNILSSTFRLMINDVKICFFNGWAVWNTHHSWQLQIQECFRGWNYVVHLTDCSLERLITLSFVAQMMNAATLEVYKAPELRKMKQTNTKTYIYNFGIILLEILISKKPCHNESFD